MNTGERAELTRREALHLLVMFPFLLGISEQTPRSLEGDLKLYAAAIAACWELRKSAEHSDLALAFEGVPSYLPVLQRVVKDSSPYRKEAAGLVMRCLLLKSILGHHLGDVQTMQYLQQALCYSKTAKDIPLYLKTLESLAVAYTFSKRYPQALQTIEQAEPLLKEIKQKNLPVSPHVFALVNGMLACALVRTGQDGRPPSIKPLHCFLRWISSILST
jgi:hypothetical protein